MSTSTASPTVLVIGGTGTISWSVVNEAVSEGMTVSVLNRGRSLQNRPLPAGVELLTADIHDGGFNRSTQHWVGCLGLRVVDRAPRRVFSIPSACGVGC
jgi:nucleoside-diphosphate-sugar epimerase